MLSLKVAVIRSLGSTLVHPTLVESSNSLLRKQYRTRRPTTHTCVLPRNHYVFSFFVFLFAVDVSHRKRQKEMLVSFASSPAVAAIIILE